MIDSEFWTSWLLVVEKNLFDVFFVGYYDFKLLLKFIFAVAILAAIKVFDGPVIINGKEFEFVILLWGGSRKRMTILVVHLAHFMIDSSQCSQFSLLGGSLFIW